MMSNPYFTLLKMCASALFSPFPPLNAPVFSGSPSIPRVTVYAPTPVFTLACFPPPTPDSGFIDFFFYPVRKEFFLLFELIEGSGLTSLCKKVISAPFRPFLVSPHYNILAYFPVLSFFRAFQFLFFLKAFPVSAAATCCSGSPGAFTLFPCRFLGGNTVLCSSFGVAG